MKAANKRGDGFDRRLERLEREATRRPVGLDAKIAALADNQVTIQAALQASTAQIDRFLRGQQRDGHK